MKYFPRPALVQTDVTLKLSAGVVGLNIFDVLLYETWTDQPGMRFEGGHDLVDSLHTGLAQC